MSATPKFFMPLALQINNADDRNRRSVMVETSDDRYLCQVLDYSDRDEQVVIDLAAFIVRACNAHDDLLKALAELVNEQQPLGIDRPAYQNALAALAKAGV